jgi:predicted acylesterase/phospholipase RssA
LWRNLRQKDVYKSYFGGIPQGLLFEKSLYKNDPLKATVKKYVDNLPIYRNLAIGVANADKATYEVHKYFAGGKADQKVQDSVIASSALPAAFPYSLNDKGEALIDGGVIFGLDLISVIRGCED